MRRFCLWVFLVAFFAGACGAGDGSSSGLGGSSDVGAGGDVADSATDDVAGGADDVVVDDVVVEDGVDVDGDDSDEEVVLTASYKGVTAETIQVGISMLDLASLVENNWLPAGWGDQEAVWKVFIDDLNARGGIYGRQVEAVYDFYSPVGTVEAEESCTVLTQDNEVFAVLGGFLGPAATVNTCITSINDTMLVGGQITPALYAESTAPWYDTIESTDQATNTLLNLMVETGRADDAKVFLITHPTEVADKETVEEAIESRGIDIVESAVLDADDGDQATQDAILEVIYERFRNSDANVIFANGNPSAILRGMHQAGLEGSVPVWANHEPGLSNLGESVDRDRVLDVFTVTSVTDAEMWDDPLLQECVALVEDALGVTVIDPAVIEPTEENWFLATRRYCRLLNLFEHIALAAGPELTYDSVEAAVADGTLRDFALPGGPHNSLSTYKPFARDEFRLGRFDVSIGGGGIAPVSELIDIF